MYLMCSVYLALLFQFDVLLLDNSILLHIFPFMILIHSESFLQIFALRLFSCKYLLETIVRKMIHNIILKQAHAKKIHSHYFHLCKHVHHRMIKYLQQWDAFVFFNNHFWSQLANKQMQKYFFDWFLFCKFEINSKNLPAQCPYLKRCYILHAFSHWILNCVESLKIVKSTDASVKYISDVNKDKSGNHIMAVKSCFIDCHPIFL